MTGRLARGDLRRRELQVHGAAHEVDADHVAVPHDGQWACGGGRGERGECRAARPFVLSPLPSARRPFVLSPLPSARLLCGAALCSQSTRAVCAGGGRRAAVRRLGAEVSNHDAVGRPAEAAVRNERHLAAWVRRKCLFPPSNGKGACILRSAVGDPTPRSDLAVHVLRVSQKKRASGPNSPLPICNTTESVGS